MAFKPQATSGDTTKRYFWLGADWGQSIRVWVYVTTDAAATVAGSGYITEQGLLDTIKTGDFVMVVEVGAISDSRQVIDDISTGGIVDITLHMVSTSSGTTIDLSDDLLTNLADGTVTTAKLADDAVTLAKIAAATAGDTLYWDGAGDPALLAKGTDGHPLTLSGGLPAWAQVASIGIADNAVTNAKMANSSVDTAELAAGALTLAKVGELSVPRASISGITIHADVDEFRTSGYTTAGDGGGASYKRVGAEPSHEFKVQSADLAWWEGVYEGFVTPEMFGAVGDGVADDATAVQNAIDFLGNTASGDTITDLAGRLVLNPKAVYLFGSQVTVGSAEMHMEIIGHGARIKTSGAIPGLRFGNARLVVARGLRVDHIGNANATEGILIEGGQQTTLHECTVVARGTSSSYAGFRVRNFDPADNNTGAFWTRLSNCTFTVTSGSTGTLAPVAIQFYGNGNGSIVENCELHSATVGIEFAENTESVNPAPANGCLIIGNSFEKMTTGIKFDVPNDQDAPRGLRIAFNRFEDMTQAYDFNNAVNNPDSAPQLIMNYYVSNVTTRVVNPNGITFNSFEFQSNLDYSGESIKLFDLRPDGGGFLRQFNSTDHPLTIAVGDGTGRGLRLTDAAGNLILQLVANSAGQVGKLQGSGTAKLNINGVDGISSTLTDAKNLRGTVTFATSGTASVSFSVAEPDTDYYLGIAGDTNETFWVTSKATGGFTLNSSNSSSTATVTWILMR